MGGLVENRYLRLRKKLDDAGYHEAFSFENVSLVERLLQDLLREKENLLIARKDALTAQQTLDEIESGAGIFKSENLRLVQENSKLRLNLQRNEEKLHEKLQENRARLRDLEAENADLKLLVKQFVERVKQQERESLEKCRRLAHIQEKYLKPDVVITADQPAEPVRQVMEMNSPAPKLCPHCTRIRNFVYASQANKFDPTALDYAKVADSRIEALTLQNRYLKNAQQDLTDLIKSLKVSIQMREAELEKLRVDMVLTGHRGGEASSESGEHDVDDHTAQELRIALKSAQLQLQVLQKRNLQLEKKINNHAYQGLEDNRSRDAYNRINKGKFLDDGDGCFFTIGSGQTKDEKLKLLEAQLSKCCEEKAKLKRLLEECEKRHTKVATHKFPEDSTTVVGNPASATEMDAPGSSSATKAHASYNNGQDVRVIYRSTTFRPSNYKAPAFSNVQRGRGPQQLRQQGLPVAQKAKSDPQFPAVRKSASRSSAKSSMNLLPHSGKSKSDKVDARQQMHKSGHKREDNTVNVVKSNDSSGYKTKIAKNKDPASRERIPKGGNSEPRYGYKLQNNDSDVQTAVSELKNGVDSTNVKKRLVYDRDNSYSDSEYSDAIPELEVGTDTDDGDPSHHDSMKQNGIQKKSFKQQDSHERVNRSSELQGSLLPPESSEIEEDEVAEEEDDYSQVQTHITKIDSPDRRLPMKSQRLKSKSKESQALKTNKIGKTSRKISSGKIERSIGVKGISKQGSTRILPKDKSADSSSQPIPKKSLRLVTNDEEMRENDDTYKSKKNPSYRPINEKSQSFEKTAGHADLPYEDHSSKPSRSHKPERSQNLKQTDHLTQVQKPKKSDRPLNSNNISSNLEYPETGNREYNHLNEKIGPVSDNSRDTKMKTANARNQIDNTAERNHSGQFKGTNQSFDTSSETENESESVQHLPDIDVERYNPVKNDEGDNSLPSKIKSLMPKQLREKLTDPRKYPPRSGVARYNDNHSDHDNEDLRADSEEDEGEFSYSLPNPREHHGNKPGSNDNGEGAVARESTLRRSNTSGDFDDMKTAKPPQNFTKRTEENNKPDSLSKGISDHVKIMADNNSFKSELSRQSSKTKNEDFREENLQNTGDSDITVKHKSNEVRGASLAASRPDESMKSRGNEDFPRQTGNEEHLVNPSRNYGQILGTSPRDMKSKNPWDGQSMSQSEHPAYGDSRFPTGDKSTMNARNDERGPTSKYQEQNYHQSQQYGTYTRPSIGHQVAMSDDSRPGPSNAHTARNTGVGTLENVNRIDKSGMEMSQRKLRYEDPYSESYTNRHTRDQQSLLSTRNSSVYQTAQQSPYRSDTNFEIQQMLNSLQKEVNMFKQAKEELEREVQKLRRSLAECENHGQQLERENQKTKLLLEQTESHLRDVQRKAAANYVPTQRENHELNQQVRQLKTREMALEREVSALNATVKALDRDKDEMRIELDRKDEKLAGILEENRKHGEKTAKLLLELKNAELQLSHIDEAKKDQDRETGNLRKQIDSLRHDLDRRIQERDNAQRELNRITQTSSKTEIEKKSMFAELERSHKEADKLRRQVQMYIDEVRRIEEILAKKEEELQQWMEHYDMLTQEKGALESQRQLLEREVSFARNGSRDTVSINNLLTNKLANQQSAVNSYEEEIKSLSEQVSTLEIQLRSSQEKEKSLGRDLNTARELCCKLETKMDALRLELANTESAKNRLSAENAELASNLEYLQKQLSADGEASRRMDELVSSLREKEYEAELRYKSLLTERDGLQAAVTQLQTRTEQLNEEINRYRLKATELKNEMEKSKRQYAIEKQERETAIAELHRLQSQLNNSSTNLLLSSAVGGSAATSPTSFQPSLTGATFVPPEISPVPHSGSSEHLRSTLVPSPDTST